MDAKPSKGKEKNKKRKTEASFIWEKEWTEALTGGIQNKNPESEVLSPFLVHGESLEEKENAGILWWADLGHPLMDVASPLGALGRRSKVEGQSKQLIAIEKGNAFIY